MIVCHCRVRNEGHILDAARETGATDAEEVARCAGAGDDCGSCLERIERLLEQHAPRMAAAV